MARANSKYLDGMYRLAEQWPYLRYLGMGAWWAWIWLCYNGTGLFAFGSQGAFAHEVGAMYLYSTPAITCALVCAALLWRKATLLLARRSFVVASSLVAVAGGLLIALSPWMGGGVVFAVGAILTGVGTSVLALKTGDVYGTLGRREVLTAGSLSLVFAVFLYFMGTGLPSAWQPLFIAVMPLASALLFVMPGDDPFPAEEPEARPRGGRAPGMRSYVRLVLAAAMVALTGGFARGVASASMTGAGYAHTGAVVAFWIFVGALAVCLAVNTGDIVRSVRRVYAVLIFFGVAVAFASAFGVNLVYINIGKELLWMVFTCLMAYMAFRFGFSPVRAFGFGQAAHLAASACGWGLGMAAAPLLANPSADLIVTTAMVLVILVVFVFVFTDADIKFMFTWKRPDDAAPEVQEPEDAARCDQNALSLEEQIAALPARFGVSSREAQIMLLFAQGHSANWIAEDLVISKNTVRSHIRSIYTKLDVHSRKELLDFLATVSA